jgi:hypothetical protein
MKIEVINRRTGRVCRVSPKDFGKILHLARFHGWSPQRADPDWPSPVWSTEIILPHVGAYMAGTVSELDAQDLADALTKVIASESSGLDPSVYFAALAVLEVAKGGEFEVQLEPVAA